MKEYDRVKLIVEKEKYAKNGAHKDMVGWICDPRKINGQWLVCFDECESELFPISEVKECDLEVVWTCPVKQVGDKVTLYVRNYADKGVPLGAKGVIIQKYDINNKWIVCFNVKESSKSITLSVDDDEIAVD